ncbi:MAG: hypothetical protein J6Q65_07225 [Lentisphaeria bacterium]|nr:hypothetical protein [Lentisphaeria bacterium]
MKGAAPQPKTLEEHREYLYDIVNLKLFYLHLRQTEIDPDEPFRDAIRNRVDIYRKTEANPGPHTPAELFFDAPAWTVMEDRAYELMKKYNSSSDSDRKNFEDEAFSVFKDSIDQRCERDYLDPSVLARYQCGSLRHDLELHPTGYLCFHIANAVRPHSIYDDPLHIPRCLLALLRVAEETFHAKGLRTHTWLNSSQRWRACFPAAWETNLSEPSDAKTNIAWHYGWWGQFISARGTLQKKNAEYLRKNKTVPYLPRTSFATIEEFKEHLKNIREGK